MTPLVLYIESSFKFVQICSGDPAYDLARLLFGARQAVSSRLDRENSSVLLLSHPHILICTSLFYCDL